MKQRRIDSSIGFVEVKPEKSDSVKRHEDMIRLVAFCKDALEKQSRKTMIAVQVVGFYISFYIFVSVDGLHLMVELYSFETAKYLDQLSHLLSSFDKLKQVIICSRDNCVESQGSARKRNSSLDISELHRIINIKKPKGLRTSLSFKK
ncbi:hypothetical protein BD408DRAFT_126598 [Parasitella parasitica]|nr:hypothetical protein BD408DRAFT_126598 [Parasitella parasitica]